ncbi:MAG TPA: transaldolase family protein [Candidatus Baltobacteraceae bacterium]|nr:transaldolase family protein [Candidatus Baltobacteraceae bacterium]
MSEQTPTRFWINNPTRAEAEKAIAAGAVGCTCNPSYCQKMLDHPEQNDFAWRMLDEAVLESDNDSAAEVILQRKLVKPIAELFQGFYDRNPRMDGFVSIQGDPVHEHDARIIIAEAIRNHALAPNVCAKIPVTMAGLQAIETLVGENVPINSTEIFAVSQAVALCETYERASRKSGRNPVIYLSHIAGIYDDFFRGYVEKNKVHISPDALWQAGLAVARKVYGILVERNYSPIFIGGGARGLHHFTEMVGGKLIVTINWLGTADKLIEQNPPVVDRLFNPVPHRVIDELMEKLPDFRRGYLSDGLAVDEFEEFGPVELFRSSFVKSWERVLGLAKDRRAAHQRRVHA